MKKINNDYIKAPFNFVGGKYKLLSQILPLFPKDIEYYYEPFGGSWTVGINVNSKYHSYNDIMTPLVRILNLFKSCVVHNLKKKICDIIEEYDLSDPHNVQKKDYNKEQYFKMRDDYNKMPVPPMLYTLITCSFSNQIRFNSKNEFNMPYGYRYFNPKMQDNFVKFITKLQQQKIKICNLDFGEYFYNEIFPLSFDSNQKADNTFIYIDPPYLNAVATYNENGGWTENDEKDLLALLDEANKKGIKFALSNNLKYDNKILSEWMKKYNVYYLNTDYDNCNYHKKTKGNDQEVLITNYS